MKGTQLFTLLVAFAVTATFAGGTSIAETSRNTTVSQTAATCPPPAPGPRPALYLSYPLPNASAVPTDVGKLIFVGWYRGVTGDATISIKTASGATVAVGEFTAPPSPIPEPHFVPMGLRHNTPFVAVSVPSLAPSTTYSVSYAFTDDGGSPPSCTFQSTIPSGSFTTK